MSKDTVIRLISSAIGIVIFFSVLFAGYTAVCIAIGIIILLMIYELLSVFKTDIILKIISFIGAAAIYAAMVLKAYTLVILLIMTLILLLLFASIAFHKKFTFEKSCQALFSVLYPSLFMPFITYAAAEKDFSIYYILMIFVCSWMTDTGGYCIGKLMGKHKLAPKLSPKKTIEGSIGGIIFSSVSSMILWYIAQTASGALPNYILITLAAAIASVVSQAGDIGASLIKRSCGVKDFGNIMPGHGGIMDRFDSVIPVAPFIVLLLLGGVI